MDKLLDALRAGEAIVVATDTVYGLAAMPGSSGLEYIFELKQRPSNQVLPLLVSGVDALDKCSCNVTAHARLLAETFWPGALTLVLEASDAIRELGVAAEDGTVALRCPDEPSLLQLLDELDAPLACTSANMHGEPAVCLREELAQAFADLPGYDMLPERCDGGQASTIVDCTGTQPRVLREGPIPENVIMDVALFG